MSTINALQLLGLPEEMAQFEGQIQTRTQRNYRVYEVSDFSSGPMKIYYVAELQPDSVSAFGMYPLNYANMLLYNGGFSLVGDTPQGYVLRNPSKWIRHEAPSGMAGQNVYYCEAKVTYSHNATGAVVDFELEPYETAVQGKAEDMKDPLIRVGYFARVITKGADGKPRISWQSRAAITPKRRLRRAEFLKLVNMNIEQYIYQTRTSFNIVKVSPSTHITSIAMDIDRQADGKTKSTVYINGKDTRTTPYQSLINSFGQKYSGFIQMYRLYNGPRAVMIGDNVYGSTIDININSQGDSTITVQAGSVNEYDSVDKVLTYNPSLQETAGLLAYMEFLPATGKNESIGKWLNLETGEESYY
jgi:hypothetical protein